ncbi:MAG: hypothetical protein NT075_34975 [Chloroflexi bacterium]|nr:hypothetical protein [Chloroflexota bacterium]
MMKRQMLFLTLIVCLLALIIDTRPARADDAVVGAGTPASCTEAALDYALAQLNPGATTPGGSLTFNCGPNPHTIVLTSPKVLNDATMIDGGDLMSLSGGSTTRIFDIATGASVEIRQLILQNGFADDAGGAIRVVGDPAPGAKPTLLRLRSVDLVDNGTGTSGGALRGEDANLVLLDSTVRLNTALDGGGGVSWIGGRIALTNTIIADNTATLGGGMEIWHAVIDLQQTTFRSNTATSANTGLDNFGDGGGLFLKESGGAIHQSWFYDNSALWGGGLMIQAGFVGLTESNISYNNSQSYGGGLAVSDAVDPISQMKVTLRNTLVQQNTAGSGGGIFSYAGSISLYDSWVLENKALNNGGGLFSFYTRIGSTYWPSYVYGSRTIFYNNQANDDGGGIYNTGSLSLVNTLLQANKAGQNGGGLAMTSSPDFPTAGASLVYNTFASNQAAVGGAIYNAGLQHTTLKSDRSLYMNNAPDSCAGLFNTSTGYNLTNDASCSDSFTNQTDANQLVLPLVEQMYRHQLQAGSSVFEFPVQWPAPDSPAINRVPAAECKLDHDLFSQPRPIATNCDVGAMERTISGKLSQTINFAALGNRTLSDAPFKVNATASSGLTVTFTTTTPTVCTLLERTVTAMATGLCTIIASQAGDATYEPAAEVAQSFQITAQREQAVYLPFIQHE